MKCVKCQNELQESDKFCSKCGYEINDQDEDIFLDLELDNENDDILNLEQDNIEIDLNEENEYTLEPKKEPIKNSIGIEFTNFLIGLLIIIGIIFLIIALGPLWIIAIIVFLIFLKR